jgi:DNA mismatch repair endonuclease MutH
MNRSEAVTKLKKLEGENLHELAKKYNITVLKDGKVNKGWAGHVFESYLGLPINSLQKPDFGDWELKSIPLKISSSGQLTAKETMAVTMIDPKNVMDNNFENSHLLTKLKKAVIISRTVGNTVHEPTFIKSILEFDLDDELYEIIKNDYDFVRNVLIKSNGDITKLSGKMGVYIQPRTKGAGHGSVSRAFYARTQFVNRIFNL